VESKLSRKCDIETAMKLEARQRELEDFSAQQNRDFEKRLIAIEEKLSRGSGKDCGVWSA